eukprot:c15864_g1_i2.p1 GENE.c15864_g1_i2~~c15864_g1_i2.p1  ORF type:complete len:283 (-),score=57.61 c15864_g1_i2:129-977(-)
MQQTQSLQPQQQQPPSQSLVDSAVPAAVAAQPKWVAISFRCPISLQRITKPFRSVWCTHFQCADLNAFVMTTSRSLRWLCPTCGVRCEVGDCVVDEFFAKLLSLYPSSDRLWYNGCTGEWVDYDPEGESGEPEAKRRRVVDRSKTESDEDEPCPFPTPPSQPKPNTSQPPNTTSAATPTPASAIARGPASQMRLVTPAAETTTTPVSPTSVLMRRMLSPTSSVPGLSSTPFDFSPPRQSQGLQTLKPAKQTIVATAPKPTTTTATMTPQPVPGSVDNPIELD